MFTFSALPAYQIVTTSNAKNFPFVEMIVVKDLARSLVAGGSIEAFRNKLIEAFRNKLKENVSM